MEKTKTILIAGGGFGGVSAAISAAKNASKNTRVVLVDRSAYHFYYPSLCELAGSDEEFVSMEEIWDSSAIKYADLKLKGVEFIQAEIKNIDAASNTAELSNGQQLVFDCAVLALGSDVDYFKVPGLAEHALTFKSIPDALKIREEIQSIVAKHQDDFKRPPLRVVIGGGGFSGVELAGGLLNVLDICAWKYSYQREKLELVVIEGTGQLLPGQKEEISKTIYYRLRGYGAEIKLNTLISKVSDKQIITSAGETLNYDFLIWTGGVRSKKLPLAAGYESDNKDRAIVSDHLLLKNSKNILVIGDNAKILDQHNKALPGTASQAIDQGKYAGKIAARLCAGSELKNLPVYETKQFGQVILVKGKWAVLHFPSGPTFYGYFGWLARKFVDWRYFASVLPFWKALRLILFDEREFSKSE